LRNKIKHMIVIFLEILVLDKVYKNINNIIKKINKIRNENILQVLFYYLYFCKVIWLIDFNFI